MANESIKIKGREIAVNNYNPQTAPAGKGILWCGGFASTMEGTKASFLADWSKNREINFLRFDYSGCGRSSGDFYDGKISFWKAEAEEVFRQFAKPKQLIVASSMGAWVAWHIAKIFPKQIAGLILIAPAPDFTEKLLSTNFKKKLEKVGRLTLDDPSGPLSHDLIEDCKKELVMGEKLKLSCPVHILCGQKDEVVPLSHVLEVMELLDSSDVKLTLIKGGDHSLSSPEHLNLLEGLVEKFYAAI